MKTVNLDIKAKVAEVTLNRPEVRNAFNDPMIAEMTDCFLKIQKDKEVRAVFLRGEGESFSAGGDLNWMKSMVDYTESENVEDSEKLFEMYQALADIPVPVVSLVQGHAMGGALGLIACSDIVFAVTGTQFCFSEVRLGLAPAVISAFVKDKVRPSDLTRYFLSAEIFGPEQAIQMGLIHEVAEAKEAAKAAEKLIGKLSNNGPLAVRETKALIKDLHRTDNLKKRTTELIAKLRVGQEGQEGLAAFFEKRKPKWVE